MVLILKQKAFNPLSTEYMLVASDALDAGHIKVNDAHLNYRLSNCRLDNKQCDIPMT